jgi:hypothetical protein
MPHLLPGPVNFTFFFLTLVVVGHLCLQEQRFLEHFNAIKDRVEHELLQVYENIPNPDLKRVVMCFPLL